MNFQSLPAATVFVLIPTPYKTKSLYNICMNLSDILHAANVFVLIPTPYMTKSFKERLTNTQNITRCYIVFLFAFLRCSNKQLKNLEKEIFLARKFKHLSKST